MKSKIQDFLKKYHPFFIKTRNILQANKIIVAIILVSILPFYFFGIRPSLIRKQCSAVVKHNNSYSSVVPGYTETAERQKQEKLVAYIECRNKNLVSGDQIYLNKMGSSPYPFTQDQYNSLTVMQLNKLAYESQKTPDSIYKDSFEGSKIFVSYDLERLNNYTLGNLLPSLYHAYNGYIIDNPTYEKLKEGSIKYPQCDFPEDFTEKYTFSGGGEYVTDSSNEYYTSCLRKNGLSD